LEKLAKSWTSQILGVKKNPMAPKSFYFEFLWLFLLDMLKNLEEKRKFWSKVCQLTLKKTLQIIQRSFWGKNGTKSPYLEEKNGFFLNVIFFLSYNQTW